MKAIRNYFKVTFKRLHNPAVMLNTLSPAEMGAFISNQHSTAQPANGYWWIESNSQ